jgi:hypothetical protein
LIEKSNSRAGPTYLVRCDGCQTSFDADTASFERAQKHARARGWQTFPKIPLVPGQRPKWLNACPTCARERAQDIQVARDALRNRAEPEGRAA